MQHKLLQKNKIYEYAAERLHILLFGIKKGGCDERSLL